MAQFLTELAATQSVFAAARVVGMSWQWAYRLKARLRDPLFDLAWEAAVQAGYDALGSSWDPPGGTVPVGGPLARQTRTGEHPCRPTTRQASPAQWATIGFDYWLLGMEAWWVIWQRSLRIAGGGALAEREAMRMVTEKWAANMDLAMKLATAVAPTPEGTAKRIMRHYRGHVRANSRRLGGG